MDIECYVEQGDHVKCIDCGKEMLIEYGAENCPHCGSPNLSWASENVDERESSIDKFDEKSMGWKFADNLTFTD